MINVVAIKKNSIVYENNGQLQIEIIPSEFKDEEKVLNLLKKARLRLIDNKLKTHAGESLLKYLTKKRALIRKEEDGFIDSGTEKEDSIEPLGTTDNEEIESNSSKIVTNNYFLMLVLGIANGIAQILIFG